MKRTFLLFILASCAITFASAQGQDRWEQRRNYGEPPRYSQERGNPPRRMQGSPRDFYQKAESASVSGNLTIVRGMIAVSSGDVTYLAGGLQRFVGFIDGLKEGAAVTLEGSAFAVPQNDKVKFLLVQKMTLNGKDYDLGRPRPNAGPNMMQRPMPIPGPMQPRPMPRGTLPPRQDMRRR